MITAKIIADSLNFKKERLTTFVVTFPRFILAELNTHRAFSRNSASSRAIPFEKMVKSVQENPFIPIAWQKDHKGMQGTEYLTDELSIQFAKSNWLTAKDWAVKSAQALNSTNNGYEAVTKQLCNRLLEPFMWHTVIITSSEEGLENFFELRCPKILNQANNKYYRSVKDWNNVDKEIQWLDISCLHPENKSQAEIHIQALAEAMWDAYNESTPKQLQDGEWHIPFGDTLVNHIEKDGLHTDSKIDLAGGWIGLFPDIDNIEDIPYDYQYDNWLQKQKLKIATARCARISYQTFGDNPKIDYEADIKLHDFLLKNYHLSPFEHLAQCTMDSKMFNKNNGNLSSGWIQYRKLIE